MLRKGGLWGDSEAPTRADALGKRGVMLGTGKEGWRTSASVGALSRLAKITVSGTRRLYELVSFLFPPLGALVSWHWGSTLEASAFGRRASRFIGDLPREGPELVESDRCFWSPPYSSGASHSRKEFWDDCLGT